MSLDDTAADGKADPASFVLVAADETLEGLKYPVRILLRKAYAPVLDVDLYYLRELFCKDPDLGRFTRLAIFEGLPIKFCKS